MTHLTFPPLQITHQTDGAFYPSIISTILIFVALGKHYQIEGTTENSMTNMEESHHDTFVCVKNMENIKRTLCVVIQFSLRSAAANIICLIPVGVSCPHRNNRNQGEFRQQQRYYY